MLVPTRLLTYTSAALLHFRPHEFLSRSSSFFRAPKPPQTPACPTSSSSPPRPPISLLLAFPSSRLRSRPTFLFSPAGAPSGFVVLFRTRAEQLPTPAAEPPQPPQSRSETAISDRIPVGKTDSERVNARRLTMEYLAAPDIPPTATHPRPKPTIHPRSLLIYFNPRSQVGCYIPQAILRESYCKKTNYTISRHLQPLTDFPQYDYDSSPKPVGFFTYASCLGMYPWLSCETVDGTRLTME